MIPLMDETKFVSDIGDQPNSMTIHLCWLLSLGSATSDYLQNLLLPIDHLLPKPTFV